MVGPLPTDYPVQMSSITPEVVACPPELRAEALALALCELAPSQRREIAGDLAHDRQRDAEAARALFAALRGEHLCGAAWGQFQPGNTAVFWPPRFDAVDDASAVGGKLTAEVVAALDAAGVAMTQALLPAQDAPESSLLAAAGFRYLTDLVYLTCERDRFPSEAPKTRLLEFVAYDESQRGRLANLLDRTYEGTLDCAALGSERQIDEVIAGYQETGEYRPSNWFFVRSSTVAGRVYADVGVLLLANHRDAPHMELIYMGLIPYARGRGWGRQIVQHAQWTAKIAGAQRLVTAVDAMNVPGLGVYRSTHFEIWDRRSVFVRFLTKPQAIVGESA
jgi:hypothetical protein